MQWPRQVLRHDQAVLCFVVLAGHQLAAITVHRDISISLRDPATGAASAVQAQAVVARTEGAIRADVPYPLVAPVVRDAPAMCACVLDAVDHGALGRGAWTVERDVGMRAAGSAPALVVPMAVAASVVCPIAAGDGAGLDDRAIACRAASSVSSIVLLAPATGVVPFAAVLYPTGG